MLACRAVPESKTNDSLTTNDKQAFIMGKRPRAYDSVWGGLATPIVDRFDPGDPLANVAPGAAKIVIKRDTNGSRDGVACRDRPRRGEDRSTLRSGFFNPRARASACG